MKSTKYIHLLFISAFFFSCTSQKSNLDETGDNATVKTPVTVIFAQYSNMEDVSILNATSVYQRKNSVKSTFNGFVEKVFIQPGDIVKEGESIFTIRTREAEALKDYHSSDTSLLFRGIIFVKAPSSGVVTDIQKHANENISDGDVMADIADNSSFAFIMSVPFELSSYAVTGSIAEITLSDSTKIQCKISGVLALMDQSSQTMSVVLKPINSKPLPENLTATAKIIKKSKKNVFVLKKSAVLTDETMKEFWVMKLINDSTAVKISVITGLRNDDKVEILSPIFSESDRFVFTGGYGLPDTAFVLIQKDLPQ